MENTNNQTLSAETKKLLYRYFEATHNLYGVIPLYKLLEIYNSQNEPISEAAFLDFVDSIDFSKKHYDVIGADEVYESISKTKPMYRDLVAEYLFALGNIDDYCLVREGQIGKTYYVPDKEKLLKYEDDGYFEKTLEFISLRAFLRNLPYLSKERADDIAEEIQLCAVINNGDINSSIRSALRLGVKLDNEQICDEFINLVTDVINHTRTHINCGHTPDELF